MFKFRKYQDNGNGGYRYSLSDKNYTTAVRLEFYPFKTDAAISLSLEADHEGAISFHLAIPYLFSAYLTLDAKFGCSSWWKRFLRLSKDRQYDGREFVLAWRKSDAPELRSGSIEVRCGSYLYAWNSGDPWWYSISITPSELIFGEVDYTTKVIEERVVDIWVPGVNDYSGQRAKVNVKMYEARWRFERFKPDYTIMRAEVSCEEGISRPGKGTTSYNCEDELLTNMSFPANTVEEAAAKFVEQGVWYRENYPL